MAEKRLQWFAWLLTLLVVAVSLSVWLPSVRSITIYAVFPLLGLLAFGLMWTHYVTGALRLYLGVADTALRLHFRLTSYLVLFLILAHPFLFELQLYLDGLGFPPGSIWTIYPGIIERAAILAGLVALGCFLLFELHRFYKNRTWWPLVEWANIVAMLLILWHGFLLGGELRTPWFQAIWFLYAISFLAAVTYTSYMNWRNRYAES